MFVFSSFSLTEVTDQKQTEFNFWSDNQNLNAADKNREREREERHRAIIQVPSTNRKYSCPPCTSKESSLKCNIKLQLLNATTSKRLQITQAQLQEISYAQTHMQETSNAQAQLQEASIAQAHK